MAHPRHAEREASKAPNETAPNIAEQTGLAAHTDREAAAAAAHAGAEMLQRNTEAALGAWESWIKMVSQSIEKIQQFGHGLSIVDQGGQQTSQSSGNMEPILRSGTVVAAGMQSWSCELFDVARKQLEQNRRHAEVANELSHAGGTGRCVQ